MPAKTKETLSKTYQKKTQREHILDAPDTYIGSIEEDETLNWTYDEKENKMVYKKYHWIPGLYKCFDEGIVNARDHYIRMNEKIKNEGDDVGHIPVKNIWIEIDKETGIISIKNDGNGIDVAKHPEHDIWIPEMIFGHFMTSTNYNKNEKKIVGGKNGFGFKLVLTYSKWGTIETVDHERGLKYIQRFTDNLSVIEKPKVTKTKMKPYTKVTWLPDYERFGRDNLGEDMYALLIKRVYDISAVTNKNVKVTFNGKTIPVKSFEQYVNMYVGSKGETKRIFETASERWEYGVCLTPYDEFAQVSFVNGIYTSKGGKHVDYITNQITRNIVDIIEKKKKVKVKASVIKEQLMVFVNCVVENPAFDSQTKDTLNTKVASFGSSCKVSDKFIEKVVKLGVMDTAVSLAEVKNKDASKKTDGKKTRRVRGIPKLVDANYAGTAKSGECTLLLCEGDSAKAGIISGLSQEDRNYYGVYPLKGKLLNVRGTAVTKVNANAEINDIKAIMGLKSNVKYKSLDEVKANLRYGKIQILCDQDVDGSHIKGLIINMFQYNWQSLFSIDSFLGFMNTPILRAKKEKQVLTFYNDHEYQTWKSENNDGKGWKVKYYKGLGTSTSKEFKEYFADKHMVEFTSSGEVCKNSVDMVFNKERAEDRKVWLENYNKESVLDTSNPVVNYDDFINKELIHFSKYDCERSIPSMVDGLKTSQRKILYSAFKRNLTSEIKVAQFSGYVSEHSGYHHGEASLNGAIVKMAQDFVGSNNINLFDPNGQFGTRLQGGDDHASVRYIFTQLNKLTRYVFKQSDDAILTYLNDDGTMVEPEYYMPILPMILVNGTKGIGTGFSTDVMCYNPSDIIEYVRWRLDNPTLGKTDDEDEAEFECPLIEPYFEGFTGDIIPVGDTKFMFVGKYEMVGKDKVRITELPIGVWTDKYKANLEKMMDTTPSSGKTKKAKTPLLKDYTDMSSDKKVDITLMLSTGVFDKLESKMFDEENGVTMFAKEFGLITTRSTSNMNLFDKDQRLHKYDDVYEIADDYIELRLEYYVIRKQHMMVQLEKEKKVLTNEARFIQEQCENVIDLRRKKRDVVIELLREREYDVIGDDDKYGYLLKMPISSVTEEEYEKKMKERDNKIKEYEELQKKTATEIWKEELNLFEYEYIKYKQLREEAQKDEEVPKVRKTKAKSKAKAKPINIKM